MWSALGLTGPEDAQPIGQFRRAFDTARIKRRSIHVVSTRAAVLGVEGIAYMKRWRSLSPQRLTDAWGIVKAPMLCSNYWRRMGLRVCLSLQPRVQRQGLGQDSGGVIIHCVSLSTAAMSMSLLSTGMPILYQWATA